MLRIHFEVNICFVVVLLFGVTSVQSILASAVNLTETFCRQNQAVLNSSLGKCLILTGSTCNAMHSYPDHFQCGTENTACDNAGFCSCVPGTIKHGFVFNQNSGDHDYTPPLRCVPLAGQKHGESCDNTTNPCYQNLVCNSTTSTCECESDEGDVPVWKEDEQLCYSDKYCQERHAYSFYENESGKCKIGTGFAICPLHMGQGEPDLPDSCPLNARCESVLDSRGDIRAFCSCNTGFKERPMHRRCFKVLQTGDTCVFTHHWDDNEHCGLGEECRNGTCSCESSTPNWDDVERRCFTPVGSRCSPWNAAGSMCGRNAGCEQSDDRYFACKCKEGYTQNGQGACAVRYLDRCSHRNDCPDGLHCMEGACRCRDPSGQWWDEEAAVCKTKVGSSCSSIETQTCVDNATCAKKSEMGRTGAVCKCNQTFTEAVDGSRCYKELGFGEACKSGECTKAKGLACMDHICVCVLPSWNYDKSTGRCVDDLSWDFCGTGYRMTATPTVDSGKCSITTAIDLLNEPYTEYTPLC